MRGGEETTGWGSEEITGVVVKKPQVGDNCVKDWLIDVPEVGRQPIKTVKLGFFCNFLGVIFLRLMYFIQHLS